MYTNRIILILIIATSLAIGQSNPFTIADSVVTVEVEINPPIVRAGEVLTVKTKALIKTGFHIFATNKHSVGPVASKVTIKPDNLIDAVGKTLEHTNFLPQTGVVCDGDFALSAPQPGIRGGSLK